MAEIRFRRCHGSYFLAEKPRKRDRKSCPRDGQQNVKGRIRHRGCHRPCGHAQDGLEKSVHIRTFFQKDSFEKRAPHSRYFSDELGALFIYWDCPHRYGVLKLEKWLLTHVWAGIRGKILLQAGLCRASDLLPLTSQILMRNERSVKPHGPST